MARFEVVEGQPGQGKSLYTARKAQELLTRNGKWKVSGFKKRRVASNMRFSQEFEELWGLCICRDAEQCSCDGYILYWTDVNDVVKWRDVDIIWDEIATELDSRNWPNLSVELKRFLSQYRKRGIDIYANTQDFSMVDVRARLMITSVKTLTKILGSRDLSSTKPPPRYIWGIILIRDVLNWREANPEKKRYGLVPEPFLIQKHLTAIYDTRQDIPLGEPPRLKHVERHCEFYGVPGHTCANHTKIEHS